MTTWGEDCAAGDGEAGGGRTQGAAAQLRPPSLETLYLPISTRECSPKNHAALAELARQTSLRDHRCENSNLFLADEATSKCIRLLCKSWGCDYCGRLKWLAAREFFAGGMEAASKRGDPVRFVTLTDGSAGELSVAGTSAAWNRLATRLKREKLLDQYALVIEVQPRRGALHIHAMTTGSFLHQAKLARLAEAAGFGKVCHISKVEDEFNAVAGYSAKMATYMSKSTIIASALRGRGAERCRPVRSSRGWFPGGLRAAEELVGLRPPEGSIPRDWTMFTVGPDGGVTWSRKLRKKELA